MLIRRIARPLLATAFIATGVDAIRRPEQLAESVQPFVDKAKTKLPPQAADLVPADAELVVRVNGAVHIIGGLALATGKFPRLASLTLAGVVIPTTLAGNDFWNETDPHERAEQQAHFIKNVGLLGGLLIATVDTEGKPSLAWRGRKAAVTASDKVAGVLPSGTGSSTTDNLTDKASHFAGVVSERSGELAEVASERGGKFAEVASERGGKFADVASERASELAHKASEKASVLADVASERGSEFAGVASERGSELAEIASKKGARLADVASDQTSSLTKAAAKRQAKLSKQAGKKQAKLGKKAGKKQANLGKRVRDNAPDAKDVRDVADQYLTTARDRAPEFAESARVYGAQLAERAADEGAKLSDKARKQADKAQKAAAKNR